MESFTEKLNQTLDEYISGKTLVPLESELINRLSDLANSYFSDDEDFDLFSETFLNLLIGLNIDNFVTYIKEQYFEIYSENIISLPNNVYSAMVGYGVFHKIATEEDDNRRLIYAIIVLNSVLARHGNFKLCLFQKQINECERYAFNELRNRAIRLNVDCSSVYDSIINNSLSVTIESLSEDEKAPYLSLAAKSWLFEFSEKVLQLKEGNDKVISFLELVKWTFDTIPSLDIVVPIIKVIKEWFQRHSKSHPLSFYISKINDSQIELFDESSTQIIADYNQLQRKSKEVIGEIELKPQEFMVYLYYELFLDKLIEEYGIEHN